MKVGDSGSGPERQPASGRDLIGPRTLLLSGTVVGLTFVAAYRHTFSTLHHQWSNSDMYSFCYVVPFVSAYIVWDRRRWLAAIAVRPALLPGLLITGLAAFIFYAGRVTAIASIEELSLVPAIAGLIVLTLGTSFLHALWFPVGYLALMLPFWDLVADSLHTPFQVFSAGMGASLLQLAGVPVHQSGTTLQLPSVELDVARACSGLNYLIAVVAIGLPVAYLFVRRVWQRVAIVTFALVVAALSNGLRVALIGAMAERHLSQALHGPGHVLTGVFVSSVGFAVIFGGVGLLSRFYSPVPQVDLPACAFPQTEGRGLLMAAAAGATMLGTCAMLATPRPAPAAARIVAHAANEWRLVGAGRPMPYVIARRQDIPLPQVYEARDGSRVSLLTIALVGNAPSGRVDYVTVELPSGSTVATLRLRNGRVLRINRANVAGGSVQPDVAFWYLIGPEQRATPNATMAKAYGAMRLLSRWSPEVALIMVTAPAPPRLDLREPDPIARFVGDVFFTRNDESLSLESK